jgi:catabolite regulation protein CreA
MKIVAVRVAMMAVLLAVGSVWSSPGLAEQIGEVRTKFKFLGANDKIVVEAFDDPDIPGATCFLSRAKTGGISGSIGMAEDTSDASLACRRVAGTGEERQGRRQGGVSEIDFASVQVPAGGEVLR